MRKMFDPVQSTCCIRKDVGGEERSPPGGYPHLIICLVGQLNQDHPVVVASHGWWGPVDHPRSSCRSACGWSGQAVAVRPRTKKDPHNIPGSPISLKEERS